MLVPVAPALQWNQHDFLFEGINVTYAELVEVVLGIDVVKDDLTLEVVLVVPLLELLVVEDLTVDVVRVVELALVDVDVEVTELPLAVAVAEGKDPEGAP